jgi:MFS family permease
MTNAATHIEPDCDATAQRSSLTSRLIDALTSLIVSALSFALLLYVGYGEARRTYEQFQIEKLVGQAELIQDTMEAFLRNGYPIRQFAGFAPLAEATMSMDDTVARMGILDNGAQVVFHAGEGMLKLLPKVRDGATERYEIREASDRVQVVLPLRNRFEKVGNIAITMMYDKLEAKVAAAFRPVLYLSAAVSLTFSIITFLFGRRLNASNSRWLGATFGVLFVAVASFVVYTLISLYSEGAQSKARAVASALGGRLDDAVMFKLSLEEFEGVNEMLSDYKRLNPDISAAAVVVDGRSLYHTDRRHVGKQWTSAPGVYEIAIKLSSDNDPSRISLNVEIPKSIIYWQVGRSVKNFAALFLASAFFAVLFLELGRALQRMHQAHMSGQGSRQSGAEISLVKPAFFLAVFLENLTYAFLPQFMRDVVASYGISSAYTSAPFMAYYLCFALALLPAGRLESRIGSRKLIVGGLLLSGATYIVMVTTQSFPMIMLARALAGIGQGALFIGVQSYTLANSSADRRTEAAGVIVFGYQAGMLSGMAIGSLLINHIGVTGVFMLGAVVAVVASFYTLIAVPSYAVEEAAPVVARSRGLARDFWDMLRDIQFLRTMCLIGVPAKAIMTGIILFALPLLMSKQGFAQEDLGQIIMLYAVSVVLVSNFAARHVDRSGGVENALFWGALLSGVGMLLIAGSVWSPALDWRTSPVLATGALIVGVCVIGLAHGLINAPVITHVADSPVAARLGASSVAANYRFVERIGHVTGPLIVSVLFATFGQNWSLLCWIAGGVCLMGFIFLSTARTLDMTDYNTEVSK